MRLSKCKALITLITIGLVVPLLAQTPKKPFPQAVNFTGCIKPSLTQDAMNTAVKSLYDSYKTSWLKTSPNGRYVESKGVGSGGGNTAITVSEQHGYGMIIFALMAGYDANAKQYFDDMFKFYKKHFSHDNTTLMSWCVQPNEDTTKDSASATDGDLDIAYSLLLAHEQWGSDGAINYLKEARKIILNGIRETNIHWIKKIIGLGDWDDSRDSSRSSDWIGDHLRIFSKVTGETGFTEVADNIYVLWKAFSNTYSATTGLVSDFTVGVPPAPLFYSDEANSKKYSFNACRVPWRFATDYAHYQAPGAKEALTKIMGWFKSNVAVSSIGEGYELNGTCFDNAGNACFVGPLAAGCIVMDNSYQQYLTDLWNRAVSLKGNNSYEVGVNLLSLLLVSGNWWKPVGEDMPAPDTTGAIIDNFENDVNNDSPRMTHLGAVYGLKTFNDVSKGGGLWYFYTDKFSSTDPGKSDISKDSGGAALDTSQVADLVSGGTLKAFMKTSYTGSIPTDARYAGIGCLFMGTDSSKFFDLSKLTGLSIRLKGKTSTMGASNPGTGMVRVMLNTEDVVKCYPSAAEAWGYFGYNITLKGKDQFRWITIDTSLLKTVDNSAAGYGEDGNGKGKMLKWCVSGKQKVNGIVFEVRKGGDNLDIEIDKIVLNGGTCRDFFGFDDTVKILAGSHNRLNLHFIRILPDKTGKGLAISYCAQPKKGVSISVFDIKGKQIASVKKDMLLLENAQLSSGVYFVRLTADNETYNTKFNYTK